MSESEKSFIKEFKKQVIAVAVIYAFMLIITSIGFYYTTNNSISNAEKERIEIKADALMIKSQIEILNEKKINKDDYIREITEMKVMLRELGVKIDRLK